MPLASNLERRDAVYYWRRRPPAEIACRIGRSHLKISLRTMDSRTARFRAAQMSAFAETLFAMPIPAILNPAQARDFFTAAFSQHLMKLAALKEIDRADGRPLDEIADMERVKGHAYRLLARHGAHGGSKRSNGERAILLDQGLSDPEADRALAALQELRAVAATAQSIGHIERLLSTIGAEASARNVAASKNIYYRALGEALIHNAGDLADDLPYEDLVEKALAHLAGRTETSAAATIPFSDITLSPPLDPRPPIAVIDKGASPSRIIDLGELLAGNKQGGDAQWTEKTASQAQSIFDLLQRFMAEEYGSDLATSLRQDRLATFDQFLRSLPKNYGKSPQDKIRSIGEIRKKAATLESAQRGLAIGTRNRHWTFIGQLIAFGRAQGLRIDRDLEVKMFHVRQKTPAPSQRPVPSSEQAACVFHTLIYTGYADWERMQRPGDLLYHRAAYWVPIIVRYTGMRREEACGLAVADIALAGNVHYFNVRPNAYRRLKNLQSQRNIAVHPELLRLGFLQYVDAIRRAGHERLFPDLYSPSSKSLLGDRLYDEIAAVMKAGGVSSHAYRHFFDDQLKQGDVREELRADLMGHAGDNETTNRYCDPVKVAKQLELLAKLPNLTEHLEPTAVRLLGWFERNEVAPWSKAAKNEPLGRLERPILVSR